MNDASGLAEARAKGKHTDRALPWNRGKLIGQKRPLTLRKVWAVRIRLQIQERSRDLAMFNLAIDSKLRGCDLVALRVDDVLLSGRVRPRATILQCKTRRPVQFEITEQTRDAVMQWIARSGRRSGDCLFPSRVGKDKPLTTRHYARLVHAWTKSIGLDPALYGTHSLRRTKVALIYRRTGNLRAVQLLLGHTKLESKVRSLGIEVDDVLALAEQTDLLTPTLGRPVPAAPRPARLQGEIAAPAFERTSSPVGCIGWIGTHRCATTEHDLRPS